MPNVTEMKTAFYMFGGAVMSCVSRISCRFVDESKNTYSGLMVWRRIVGGGQVMMVTLMVRTSLYSRAQQKKPAMSSGVSCKCNYLRNGNCKGMAFQIAVDKLVTLNNNLHV